MTRTDEGYAGWKDDLKRVKDARIQAKGVIGWRTIKAFFLAGLTPVMEWLVRKIEGRK